MFGAERLRFDEHGRSPNDVALEPAPSTTGAFLRKHTSNHSKMMDYIGIVEANYYLGLKLEFRVRY